MYSSALLKEQSLTYGEEEARRYKNMRNPALENYGQEDAVYGTKI